MKLDPKKFGLSIAIVAAFIWSFFSLAKLCLDILIITLGDGTIYHKLGNFNWAGYVNKYLVEVIGITLIPGILGWLVAEIYNELEDVFSLKLK